MSMKWTVGFIFYFLILGGSGLAQDSQQPLTLEESIKIALERNLKLHSATEGIVGSEFRQAAAKTDFLPKWTGEYSYTRYNSPTSIGNAGKDRDLSNFNTSIKQPLFSGGSITSNYRLEKLGVDLSKTNVEVVKRDIILQVREGYFNILRAEKFLAVAQQAVK